MNFHNHTICQFNALLSAFDDELFEHRNTVDESGYISHNNARLPAVSREEDFGRILSRRNALFKEFQAIRCVIQDRAIPSIRASPAELALRAHPDVSVAVPPLRPACAIQVAHGRSEKKFNGIARDDRARRVQTIAVAVQAFLADRKNHVEPTTYSAEEHHLRHVSSGTWET